MITGMAFPELNELENEISIGDGGAGGRLNPASVAKIVAELLAVYNIIIASRILTYFGWFIPMVQHRAINLTAIVVLLFTWYSARGKKRTGGVPWYDWVLMAMGIAGAGYAAVFYDQVIEYSSYGYVDTKGIIIGALIVIPLLEMVRRVTGWVLPAIIVAFLLMTVFQNYLPGILYGKGYDLDRLGYSLYAGGAGIFGMPLGVATSILIIYIIFARLMQMAGGGQWFIDIALSLTGQFRGGPAKAAVMASGFFGMISGSPAANVASTGAFTIPLMKSIGYRSSFAGAVEAVASTGGQFTPPVMGAVAFVMAEWLAVPYYTVAFAALIPAALYYVVLFMSIHFEARRRDLPPIPRHELPVLKETLRKGWHYLPPLIGLIYLLIIKGYAPEMSAIFAIILMIGFSFFSADKEQHLTPRRIWKSLAPAVQSWLTVGVITAGVGMMIGALELSGMSIRFTRFLIELSGGNLLLTLILVGVAAFIIGMGLDALPAYITLASIAAPAIINLGVPMLDAHLFVMYLGLASFITPPVCIAVFVACGISGSKVAETGWEAVRLGIAVFIVPFAFVYNRALLLQGSPFEVTFAVLTALIGALLVAAAIRGYLRNHLTVYQRIPLFFSGLLLISPGWLTAIIAIVLAVPGLVNFKSRSTSINA